MRQIVIGATYRHFKGNLYKVEDLARDSETTQTMVIYRQMYGNKELWVRPLEMFLSKVDKDKYPDVEQEYRFEFVS